MTHGERGARTCVVLCAAMLLALGLSGCSSKTSAAQQACRDFVTTFGDKSVECGFDRSVNENAVENGIGGCGGVDDVRDLDSFYGACLPSIRAWTCTEFDSPDTMLDASCSGQLLRR